eukprot:12459500-Heterocapsa_arctica.AAC.1
MQSDLLPLHGEPADAPGGPRRLALRPPGLKAYVTSGMRQLSTSARSPARRRSSSHVRVQGSP